MVSMLQGIGSLLGLEAVTLQVLPCFEAAALSGIRVLFDVSCGAAHSVLLDAVGVFGCRSAPMRTFCENGVSTAARAPRTSCFLLSTMCGIHTPERPYQFPHRILDAASA
jgi:hypothetical protein